MIRRAALPFAALLLAACSRGEPPAARGPRPVAVKTALASARDVDLEVRAVGRIVSNRSVAIRAQVSGTLLSAHFTEGQAVHQGDVLLRIDPRPYQAALDAARARLAQDRARAENAREDARRFADLVEKEYVTRQQYDAARATATASDAAVAADQAAVEQAALELSWCTIRAPLTGRSGRLLVQPGNLVSAAGSTPLLTIEQLQPVFASFSVPERHLATLRGWRGAPPAVRVEVGGGRSVTGTLDFVDNAVDAATGTILLKARLGNEDEALWPGQVVDVRLQVARRAGAVVVPAAAVAQGQQGDYAYVVDAENRARLRPVVVEQAGDAEVILARGIAAGERVVIEGQLKLTPDALVEAVDGAGGPGAPRP
ncbi:MAG: efflux RND transporter periplasmic adaptor subunit [Anaeromyxobacter sp.]